MVTCSALKRAYRDRLSGDAGDVRFVFLHGDQALLADRLSRRTGHFMPPALLTSQLATLEPPTADENPIAIDITLPLQAQIAAVITALGLEPSTHARQPY